MDRVISLIKLFDSKAISLINRKTFKGTKVKCPYICLAQVLIKLKYL